VYDGNFFSQLRNFHVRGSNVAIVGEVNKGSEFEIALTLEKLLLCFNIKAVVLYSGL
jgi:hypothetical protein